MNEAWLPVVGFEEIYEVSSEGRVRRLRAAQGTRAGFDLSPIVDNKGYRIFNLHNRGSRIRAKAHRLVLEAFAGPANGLFGLHADDDPANNSLSNLRWGTPKENMADRKRNGGEWFVGTNAWSTRTHCSHGHEYTEENTHHQRRGDRTFRRCRECRRISARARKPAA